MNSTQVEPPRHRNDFGMGPHRSASPRMIAAIAGLLIGLATGFPETACAGAEGELSRPGAYSADVTHFYNRLQAVHPDLYRVHSQTQWQESYEALLNELDNASFAEFLVGISRFAALAADGHTNLVPFYSPTPEFQARLPIKAYIFKDGVYVIAATAAARSALGGEILAINGHPIRVVLEGLATVIGADNPQWALRWAPVLLQIPLYLEGLGLGAGDVAGPQRFKLRLRTGEIAELPLQAADQTDTEWIDARSTASGRGDSPYRFETDRAFDFAHWDAESAVYVVYNDVRDEPDETVAQFAARLFEFIETRRIKRLILDLRQNGGGNNYLNQPLLHGMIKSSANRPGGLYILTGRKTFSAAMNLVTRAERHTQAMMVGEPTAAAPNHYGDPVFEKLPNSGLPYLISSLYWQDSQPNDERPWIYPDIPVQETFDAWFEGYDGAIGAALAYDHADSEITPPNARWMRPSQRKAWATMLDPN